MANLGMRAFRRPLAEEDIAERLAYYHDGRANGGAFERGIEFALAGILASPHFLYRAEEAPVGVTAGTYRITDLELASRLSFFLWNTLPDDELRTIAARNELREPEVLRAQIERMLADPRSESLASNFAYQWLHLEKLDDLEPDRGLFPQSSRRNDQRRTSSKRSRCSSIACSARTAASSTCWRRITPF